MRSRTRGTVPLAPQYPAVDLVVKERRREEMERGFVLRQVDVLPNPSATAVVERGHQHRGGKARGDEIGVGTVRRGWVAVRPAGDMIVARERGHELTKPWVQRVWPRLPLLAGREHDQPGVHPTQLFVVDAPVAHRLG